MDEQGPMIVGPSNPNMSMGPSITRGHFPLSKMGMGLLSPSKFEFVVMFNSFVFDKIKKQIVRQA